MGWPKLRPHITTAPRCTAPYHTSVLYVPYRTSVPLYVAYRASVPFYVAYHTTVPFMYRTSPARTSVNCYLLYCTSVPCSTVPHQCTLLCTVPYRTTPHHCTQFAPLQCTAVLHRTLPQFCCRFFNALAEEPETVAADLVPRIRAVQVGGGAVVSPRTPCDPPGHTRSHRVTHLRTTLDGH